MNRFKWAVVGLLAVILVAAAAIGIFISERLHDDVIELEQASGDLAFISDRDGVWDIYVLAPDGKLGMSPRKAKATVIFSAIPSTAA